MPSQILISEFVEKFVRVEGKPFMGESGFEHWPFLKAIYNDPSRFRIVKASRQCSKSTTLGNIILSYSCLIPGFRSLYVAPRPNHMSTFSNDRLRAVINQSPLIKKMTSTKLTNKVTEKIFINESIVRLRTAFLTPDQVRGIPSRLIAIDEFQNINIDFVPVILECAATFPTNKIVIFTGTPLTLDNPIEHYWSYESTMNEWMTKCSCGLWNGVGMDNIGEKGYVCSKCKKGLNIREGQWVSGRSNATFSGYHINQLMVPFTTKDWDTLLIKKHEYSVAQFKNEVLGESWDSGTKPITREELIKCCQKYGMISHPSPELSSQFTIAGIDWGTGEKSYTVLFILMFLLGDKYRITYAKRYEGAESNQDTMMQDIIKTLHRYNITKIGADYGFGFYYNFELARNFGADKVVPIYYSDGAKHKLKWDGSGGRLVANRTMIMDDTFQLLKKGDIQLPRQEEFMDPFGDDILSEYIEEGRGNFKKTYSHPEGRPDDSLHALVYSIIAAQFVKGNRSLFEPQKLNEDNLSRGY